jgi:hypothetical protein
MKYKIGTFPISIHPGSHFSLSIKDGPNNTHHLVASTHTMDSIEKAKKTGTNQNFTTVHIGPPPHIDCNSVIRLNINILFDPNEVYYLFDT